MVRMPYCRPNDQPIEDWRIEASCKDCPHLVWIEEHRIVIFDKQKI